MSNRTPLDINGITVEPGQSSIIKLPVGRLPSGNQIHIQAHVFHSPEPGPVMLTLAGVHGDEINGVEIIRRALTDGLFDTIERGSIIAIPILNLYAFINFSRDVPNGKDVNRSFPGRLSGSLASRVARTLTKRILPHIDFGIDFHTGSQSLYNYPQIRFTRGHTPSQELAREFGAPFLVAKPAIASSLRKVTVDNNKPLLVFEGGESSRYDELSISQALAGLSRIMVNRQLVSGPVSKEPVLIFHKTSWVRAPNAGLFRCYKNSGQEIVKGEPLGEINDPYGLRTTQILAPRDGCIIGHNNSPVVSQGDGLFHVGYDVERD